ncbi:hypothetical protein F8M41_024463 [Gigaspora margarita]|uniref:Granulins domain-containing protein n=1 Tax=Gigaspora margarita TaxID=4874 RepID=A0A8H3XN59_GIGMA|nr:hypothetical protein F8M41_024463 [Gigaspora margarita]
MKPIYTILLTFVIVFFLFGVSESNVLPRNGSFPAAKIYHGLEGNLKERALSCPSYAPLYCPSYDFCCPAYDGSCCPGGCCAYLHSICCSDNLHCCPAGTYCCKGGCCY